MIEIPQFHFASLNVLRLTAFRFPLPSVGSIKLIRRSYKGQLT